MATYMVEFNNCWNKSQSKNPVKTKVSIKAYFYPILNKNVDFTQYFGYFKFIIVLKMYGYVINNYNSVIQAQSLIQKWKLIVKMFLFSHFLAIFQSLGLYSTQI